MHKFLERFSFHRTGFRMLKIVHSVDSTLLPLHLMHVVLEIAEFFIGLFLTAHLIDALLEGTFDQAAEYVLAMLVINLLAGFAGQVLKKRFETLETKCTYAFYVMMREKALDLDYETMEKPEIVDKIVLSERTSGMYGGLGKLADCYRVGIKALLTLAVSVVLVLTLCFFRPAETNGLFGYLAGVPGSILFLFCVVAGVGALALRVTAISAGKEKELVVSHAGVENKLTYLLRQVFMNYKAGKVIRIFDMKDMLLENGTREMKKMHDFFHRMGIVCKEKEMRETSVNGIFSLGAYLLVAAKVVTGAITIGSFTTYVGALNQFGSAFLAFIQANSEIERICIYMQEFLEFLDLENRHATGSIPVEKRKDGEFELAFEDVSFHYPGNEELVLNHVNCKLNMKGKMAVVGRNGAGKTTFIKLLCRLYEPTEGRITLNGVDIRKYSEEEYRDLFGVVFQDFKLFAFPVWENIAAGFPREDEKLWKCLKQAGADSIVKNMPEQLETFLYKNKENGVEISGGEAQKLALARALYKDAPVVILDEPTAALDPISEAEVYAGFDEMVKEKTSIYISHRMSSCRFCDDIIVFDAGRIVERGSHEALLLAGGQYAKMWNAQAKYYAS